MTAEIIFRKMELVKKKKPLIHCITNGVTINDCANVILSAGASPIMAEHPREVQGITQQANALVLNLGNISDSQMEAILISAKAANAGSIPIVLDPVGVGCSALRREFASKLFSLFRIDAVRGNMSEIKVLCGLNCNARGVDAGTGDTADEENVCEMAKIPMSLAKIHNCTVTATGKIDIVTDGKNCCLLLNGDKIMSDVTGTGCMSSTLMGAYCGVGGSAFEACTASTAIMGVCGELAAKSAKESGKGTGTFKTNFFDKLYTLTKKDIDETLKIKNLTQMA